MKSFGGSLVRKEVLHSKGTPINGEQAATSCKVIRPGRTFLRQTFILMMCKQDTMACQIRPKWWHLFKENWNGIAMMEDHPLSDVFRGLRIIRLWEALTMAGLATKYYLCWPWVMNWGGNDSSTVRYAQFANKNTRPVERCGAGILTGSMYIYNSW